MDEHKISEESIRKATGQGREYWFGLLDPFKEADHRRRVAALSEAGLDSKWWQQTLAIEYEKAHRLRAVGETAESGWQLGMQKTLTIEPQILWDLMVAPAGLALWLGRLDHLPEAVGESFTTAEGIQGEVRSFEPPLRIRLQLLDPQDEEPKRLQLTLVPNGFKTSLRVHWELLLDANEREAKHSEWKGRLEALEAYLTPKETKAL
ncbi:MAG: hypothetical protein RRB13_15775 [bacterium]|nr:hypothetical protein [bacterium]